MFWRMSVVALLVALCMTSSPTQAAEAKADLSKLTALAEKALKAYNEDDAKTLASLCSKEGTLTEENVKKDLLGDKKGLYGKVLDKQLNKNECILAGDFLVVSYTAKFEKNAKVRVVINCTPEGKDFSILQITLKGL
jgi:hypothetical protein